MFPRSRVDVRAFRTTRATRKERLTPIAASTLLAALSSLSEPGTLQRFLSFDYPSSPAHPSTTPQTWVKVRNIPHNSSRIAFNTLANLDCTTHRPPLDDKAHNTLQESREVSTPPASCATTAVSSNGMISTTRSVSSEPHTSPRRSVDLPTPRVSSSRRSVLRPSSPTPPSESVFVFS